MKKNILDLITAILAGLIIFFITRSLRTQPGSEVATVNGPDTQNKQRVIAEHPETGTGPSKLFSAAPPTANDTGVTKSTTISTVKPKTEIETKAVSGFVDSAASTKEAEKELLPEMRNISKHSTTGATNIGTKQKARQLQENVDSALEALDQETTQ